MGITDINTPAKPVHRDEALRMMLKCPRPICIDANAQASLVTQSDTWYNEARENPYLILQHCQWFDFGRVDVQTIKDAANDAKPFLHEGYVSPPYPDTAFRVRIVAERAPDEGIEIIMAWESFDQNEAKRLINDEYYNIPASQRVSFAEALAVRNNLNRVYTFLANDDRLDMIACGMYYGTKWSSIEMKSRQFNFYEGRDSDDRSAWIPAAIQLACWNMLNTKNIRKRVVVPDEKLQKARAKSGKPPLAITTYIDAGQYEVAAQATRDMQGAGYTLDGKRKSPRMHLRRAHLRRYKNDGHITPVAAMIVNADAESVVRKEYKRKEHSDAPVSS